MLLKALKSRFLVDFLTFFNYVNVAITSQRCLNVDMRTSTEPFSLQISKIVDKDAEIKVLKEEIEEMASRLRYVNETALHYKHELKMANIKIASLESELEIWKQ